MDLFPIQDPFGDSNWGQQADAFGSKVAGQAIDPSIDPFSSEGNDPFASLVVAKEVAVIHNPFPLTSDGFQQEDPFQSTQQGEPFQSNQLVDPFIQSVQQVDPFQSNGVSPPVTEETVSSDPFLASNTFAVNIDPTIQTNPFTKPTPVLTGSNTMRRQKDPLELLNEELGIIKKEEPKPTIAMNQMRVQK
eukprot:TRINITY_DN19972_c2_g1_i1.p1 TRINITY_DN19972_c2_g1~~TRINITY_DN19972_c2_g1_i1.p1  ORF type:complete len:190 (-),score=15.84 TRINITY_DN19972_c2_g1_i1:335-904(-)